MIKITDIKYYMKHDTIMYYLQNTLSQHDSPSLFTILKQKQAHDFRKAIKIYLENDGEYKSYEGKYILTQETFSHIDTNCIFWDYMFTYNNFESDKHCLIYSHGGVTINLYLNIQKRTFTTNLLYYTYIASFYHYYYNCILSIPNLAGKVNVYLKKQQVQVIDDLIYESLNSLLVKINKISAQTDMRLFSVNIKNDTPLYNKAKKEYAELINDRSLYFYCTNNTKPPKKYKFIIDNLLLQSNELIVKNRENTVIKLKNIINNSPQIFIDFEVSSCIDCDYSKYTTNSESLDCIFNIGIYIVTRNNIEFKSLFIDRKRVNQEIQLVDEFFRILDMYPNSYIYHWSGAEIRFLNRYFHRYSKDNIIDKYCFVDLCGFCIDNNIVFPASKNYKLKQLIQNLQFDEAKFPVPHASVYNIETNTYTPVSFVPDNYTKIKNGLDAVAAFILEKNEYNEEIMYYNMMDCVYIKYIYEYLIKKFIGKVLNV